jgi:outer membrane biosynthesis protein TonB
MQGVPPADQDRLPWLEPYRETMAQERRVARRSHGGLAAYAGALILLIAAAGAGYWYGQHSDAPAPPQPSATVALPAPKPAPVKTAEAPPTAAPAPVAEAAPPPAAAPLAEAPVVKKAAPAKKVAKRRPPKRKKIRNAGVQRPRHDAVRTAQERQAPRRPWPKMPSPGPAGQVIQLGAFSTPTRANAAYSQRIARYKALASMPKVVVPVVTKPDGRVLYVLRLGTTSRQQSKTVCRNLRVSGDHCLVIG